MKSNTWTTRLFVFVLIALFRFLPHVFAQGTAFTYQGRLNNGASAANGSYDLRFLLYDSDVGGNQQGPIVTNAATAVSGGLFVVVLDFASAFDGTPRWLEIAVRTNGSGAFTTLNPRQQVTPGPYAITSLKLAGYDWSAIFNSTNPATGSIPGSRILTNSITSAQITNAAIVASKIAASAVTTSAIADGAVTAAKVSTPITINNLSASGDMNLAGDLHFTGTYHNASFIGGNSIGYLYGSYNAPASLGDGIHLGYNWYADANGTAHMPATGPGSGTSRISAGYGFVRLFVGDVSTAPYTLRLEANTSGVNLYGTVYCNGGLLCSSDRNVKRDIAPVSPEQILGKVSQLPLSEWSYKDDAATRHIGPMAQDFYSAFNIGADDKHIAPMDEGGVALAAIQALNQKLNQKDSEIQELRQNLSDLKELVSKLATEKNANAR